MRAMLPQVKPQSQLELVRADGLLRVARDGSVFLHHDGSAPEVIRERIERLKDHMLTLTEEQIDFHVEHEVCDSVYLRKLFIPKDAVIVGKVHLKHCHNVVAKGSITVLTETGCARLEAGYSGMSPPGTQKLGHAHEDTIFINVFHTDKTSIEEIEAEISAEVSARDRKELVCL